MGYIRVRQGRYQANVRRKGYSTVTKTFTSREVAFITGHEDLKMLKRYTHIKPESLVARLGWVCELGIRCIPHLQIICVGG